MNREELRTQLLALDEVQDAFDWAYALSDGHLRCPDCNLMAVEDDGIAEGPLPWSGAVKVTSEKCHDCGVILSEDPGCSPALVAHDVLRSQDMFGADSVFGPNDYTAAAKLLLLAG